MIFISIMDAITFSFNDAGVSYGITGCIKIEQSLVGEEVVGEEVVEESDEDEEEEAGEESDEGSGIVGVWAIGIVI